jgi:predicted DCC family thiol-disulfide oxidoreductase YuxK
VPRAHPGHLGLSDTPAATTWHLVYDGDCAFCARCVALLQRWGPGAPIVYLPFQDQAALAALPPVARSDLEQAMHLFAPDGAVYAGAAAAPALLRLMPGGAALAAVFAVPGVPVLAAQVYRVIARHRHRLGCGSASCQRGR